MNSIKELIDFINHNKLSAKESGNSEFNATVKYHIRPKNINVFTSVKIFRSGYSQDGKIEITESGDLNLDKHHLDFSPNFQTYNYDRKNNLLVVSGSSKKMGENYKVSISPIDD